MAFTLLIAAGIFQASIASAQTVVSDLLAGKEGDESSIVTATAVANTTAIKPGTTATLGVIFKIRKDWHIYWENPGETGYATKVQWSTDTPGARFSATKFPAPIYFVSPGPLDSYGYSDEVMLMTDVYVDPAEAPKEIKFTGKASWLMCSDRCIPGKQELTLTLPVGEMQPNHQQEFEKYESLVPKPYRGESVKIEKKAEPHKLMFGVTVTPKSGAIVAEDKLPVFRQAMFFPHPQKNLSFKQINRQQPDTTRKLRDSDVKCYSGPIKLEFELEHPDQPKPPSPITGVLVFQEIDNGSGTAPKIFSLPVN